MYLCVPTPQSDDGSADLSYIRAAAAEIGPLLAPECIVVNKSTVPVGSARVVEEVLGRDDVSVVSNPEFLREGSAVHDSMNPDRIVIGSHDQVAAARVAGLFSALRAPVIVTDPASAETIKYASNAFLAAKVTFANAVANVCEAVGADVRDVLLGMGYDKRIGFEFLRPGPGYGGSCFLGDESVMVRRAGSVRLLSFEELFAEVERHGPTGWDALAWRGGEPTPEFLPVALFTRRPYVGDVIEVRTKMGRRVTVTEDHPFVVGTGETWSPLPTAAWPVSVTTQDWLPVAQHFPLVEAPAHAAAAHGWAAAGRRAAAPGHRVAFRRPARRRGGAAPGAARAPPVGNPPDRHRPAERASGAVRPGDGGAAGHGQERHVGARHAPDGRGVLAPCQGSTWPRVGSPVTAIERG